MFERIRIGFGWKTMCLAFLLLAGSLVHSDDQTSEQAADRIAEGQRVFSAGHSFHVFVPGILSDMAKAAGIQNHGPVGLSSIGGSRVIQHWDVAEDKNKAKEVLRTGKVDVLTLSPIHLPDEGIENFAKLGLEHNPRIRVTVQEFWLPFDIYDITFKERPAKVDHNALTGVELRNLHAPYFKTMDEHVSELNKKFGRTVLYVVPVGQAVIALREKIIAGQAPGLTQQEDLFSDAIGHAQPPLQALVAYCHFAVIYRRSPVGLPMPAILEKANNPNWDAKLNRLLQELAWDAVVQHPLSGVQAEASPTLQFRDLFNGKDLSGWVNVNTTKETWTVRDGLLVCSGHPIGVMRTDKQYENFLLHIEWRHMEAGGNSGVFAWSEGTVPDRQRLPKGLEVQMLELDWINLHKNRDGSLPPIAYVHGELFGANGLKTTPDNPRGSRSKSIENRCKGKGEWNVYDVVCVDGVVKLSVNGRFVNGVSQASVKKGYLCLESEGAEIHFRNIRIMELPPGVTTAEQTAPVVTRAE